MLREYVKSRWRVFVIFGLFTAIFTVVFILSGADPAPVGYGALLCAVAAILLVARDALRLAARHKVLADMAARAVPTAEGLPQAQGLVEADYQHLVTGLHQRLHQMESRQAEKETDMLEYYTLWVHQVKTPLAAMRLLLEDEPADRDALAQQLRRVEEYAEMALQYIRAESMQADLRIRSCDLDDMVRQAVRSHAKTFIKKDIKLAFEETGQQVLTDEKWLVFVLEQLLSNALKYTLRGEISISLAPPVTLVIRDTGKGIDAADLPRVFEKGFTGYRGREDKRSTGIGLYLCRKILTRLNHGIRMESQPGVGTAVYLDLASNPPVWD